MIAVGRKIAAIGGHKDHQVGTLELGGKVTCCCGRTSGSRGQWHAHNTLAAQLDPDGAVK